MKNFRERKTMLYNNTCFISKILISVLLMLVLVGCSSRTMPSATGTESDLTVSHYTREVESETSTGTVLESLEPGMETYEETFSESLESETETDEETVSESMEPETEASEETGSESTKPETETPEETSSSEVFVEDEMSDENRNIDLESLNEPIDAAVFFEENGEIVSSYDAVSGSAFSEAEVIKAFAERGFFDAQIISYFSMDGKYIGDVEANPDSTDQHPCYEGWYISTSGEYWQVSCYNNAFMASPLSYNLENAEGRTPVLLSETDTVCSYDNTTNTYFETRPREDVLRVIRVDVLNSATLDNMTKEALTP